VQRNVYYVSCGFPTVLFYMITGTNYISLLQVTVIVIVILLVNVCGLTAVLI
jgi:hypothetical protein